MKRKLTKQYAQTDVPIRKMDNVPGPEDSFKELEKHFRLVQAILACHRYDDVIAACHWCCEMEAGLAFAKPDKPRGTRMFCSERCAKTHAAYRVTAHNLTKPKSETGEEEDKPPTTIQGTAIGLKSSDKPATKPNENDDDQPSTEAKELVSDEPAETTPPESPSTWKPESRKARKPRKAKAKKPERTDGKCAKGMHKMTDANRYEYNGTVWCRECRKASRAKSKNGNSTKSASQERGAK